MRFSCLYLIFRYLSKLLLRGFYRSITVTHHEVTDFKKPIIIFCTHTNMGNIAIVAATFPRPVRFWAKSSIFKINPIFTKILNSLGVIPVDRETKNNRVLFEITFNAMKELETLVIYPEGTSHTSPHLLDLKDGGSWVALQYKYNMFNHREKPSRIFDKLNDVTLLPVGITYLEKSKYRSNVIVTYGTPIHIGMYKDDFLIEPKNTVKKLTKAIQERLWKITINAENWDILRISEFSRNILFGDNKNINAKDYVSITQSFINIFELRRLDTHNDISDLYNILEKELKALKLSSIEAVDIINLHTISRKWFLFQIIRTTTFLVIHILLVLPIILIHIPTYITCFLVEKMQKFDESKAQNKILIGFFVFIVVDIYIFFAIRKAFAFHSFSETISLSIIFITANCYNKIVDGFCDRWKHFKKTWNLGWVIFSPYGKSYILERLHELQEAKKKLIIMIQSGQGKDIDTIREAFESIYIKHFQME
ncbi:hypothetical protein MERGE_002469 [Pneumocystis wakefieldiae]|uniref:Phospholipid/glycerol acyltransferase domain-containing protein n=1 Tax=Pneumocystis wakefieldiae TaxID=38082 RepID=A0A899FXZ1_9ASCO|nr:hypothetical protein MERGE_002469 [Pneumocystis wakefieldiae]